MNFWSKTEHMAAVLSAAAMISGAVTSGLSAQDTKPGGSGPAPGLHLPAPPQTATLDGVAAVFCPSC